MSKHSTAALAVEPILLSAVKSEAPITTDLHTATVAPIGTPTATHEERYLFGKSGTLRTFSLLCLLMVFDFADRMILAALIPALKQEWQITDTTAGLLSSALTLGMVLLAFPASIFIDRWSRIKTASLMGIVWGLASAAGALTSSVTQLVFTRALVGVGEAGYAPAAYAWISAAFPKRRRQLALGTFSAAQPIGMALGVALGGFIATHYGWRHALGIIALPGLIVAAWLYRGRDYKNIPANAAQASADTIPTEDLSAQEKNAPSRGKAILRTPSLLLAYFAGAMGALQWVPVVYFLPTFLNRIHDIPVQKASLLTSSVMLFSIVAVPLGGWVMDRWNQRSPRAKLIYPLLAGFAGMLLNATAFSWASSWTAQYALIVTAVFFISSAGTGPLAMTQELVHPAIRALSGTSSVVAIHLLGSVPGPLLAGLISDHYSLPIALLSLGVLGGVLQALAMLLALRYYPRDLSRVGHYTLEAA